jgi:hypothetical protein
MNEGGPSAWPETSAHDSVGFDCSILLKSASRTRSVTVN